MPADAFSRMDSSGSAGSSSEAKDIPASVEAALLRARTESESSDKVEKMPRTYEKAPGKRSYASYSMESVVAAVDAVNKRNYTVYAASKVFGVPYGTIFNKVNGLHPKAIGGQTFLTESQEMNLRMAIEFVGEWGFPLSPTSIRKLVKS